MADQKLNIIISAIDEAKDVIKGVSSSFDGLKDASKTVGIAMTAMGGSIVYAGMKAIESYGKQEQAEARLTQALKNQGNFTDENVKQLEGLARARQKVTVFGDEETISAQALLAAYKLNVEQISQLTPLVQDLATMTARSTGGQMDLEGAAKLVGLALDGQAGRLRQAGIVLTDFQTKALDEATSSSEKFAIMLDVVKQNAGGLSESVGGTASASLIKLQNVVDDLWEEIGSKLIPILVPLIEKIGEVVSKVIDWTQVHPELTKVILTVVATMGGLMAILGPFLLILPGIVTAVGAFITIFGIAQTAIVAFNIALMTTPIGWIIAGIGALIAITVLLVKNWDTIKQTTVEVWNMIKNTLGTVLEYIGDKIDIVINKTKNLINKIKEITGGTISKVTGVAENVFSGVKNFLGFATGGVVTKPTIGMIGEDGPEAVIPLSKIGSIGSNNFNFNFSGALIADKDKFISEIKSAINRESELRALAGT